MGDPDWPDIWREDREVSTGWADWDTYQRWLRREEQRLEEDARAIWAAEPYQRWLRRDAQRRLEQEVDPSPDSSPPPNTNDFHIPPRKWKSLSVSHRVVVIVVMVLLVVVLIMNLLGVGG